MTRRYGAVLVRCWHRDGGAQRGEPALVAWRAAVLAWITACAGDAPDPRRAPSARGCARCAGPSR
jgi:hypothetical protein